MGALKLRTPQEREQMREACCRPDEAISDEERRRMNRDFVQVYPKGWARMRELLRETKSQAPLLLYTFIAEHIDADGGVLVADQETICEAIGVSRTTLWRAIAFLEERNALFADSRGRIGQRLCPRPHRDLEIMGQLERAGRFHDPHHGPEVRSARADKAPNAGHDEGAHRRARTAFG